MVVSLCSEPRTWAQPKSTTSVSKVTPGRLPILGFIFLASRKGTVKASAPDSKGGVCDRGEGPGHGPHQVLRSLRSGYGPCSHVMLRTELVELGMFNA